MKRSLPYRKQKFIPLLWSRVCKIFLKRNMRERHSYFIVQWNLSKPNLIRTNLCDWFIQAKLTKILYFRTWFNVWFIQDSILFKKKVCVIQISYGNTNSFPTTKNVCVIHVQNVDYKNNISSPNNQKCVCYANQLW